MSQSISFNPALTTNIQGSFQVQSRGFIQGMAIDNPTTYGQFEAGPLASTETISMWPGVAIATYIPATGSEQLGSVVKRALNNTSIIGFSIGNQIGNAIMTPGGTVPLLAAGQKVSYASLGSDIIVPLQIDPALVTQDGSITTTSFSWDFDLQRLTLFSAAYAQQTPSAYTSYNSATGVLSLTFGTALPVVVGQYVAFAGFTGAQVGLNTSMAVLSTTGTVLTFQAPVGLGSFTPANGYLLAGGGAVGIRRVTQIVATGCKTVTYAPATGTISWNENGAVALCTL